jgi:hypothetical protein
MKQEEFIRLKQGGDTVMQYLNKFNHLSQYAIDQVNTDLKKKNCFMRGLNGRLQRKMATCLDLTYSRDVTTALAVEAKTAGHGKSFFASPTFISIQATCLYSSHYCPRSYQSAECP